MKTYKYILAGLTFALCTSCFDDLNTVPIDPNSFTSEEVYRNPDNYKGLIAKLYAGLVVTGQGDNQGDITAPDEGLFQYTRALWFLQEMPTDVGVSGWNNTGQPDICKMSWSANDPNIYATYSRIYFQIGLCNEFLRETTQEKLNDRGINLPEVEQYRMEARFLRAFSYWHAIDLFGNVPFSTEANSVGSALPEQKSRQEIFEYIEGELLAIVNNIAEEPQYGRAGKAAVQTLLAKLYLNAEVYTGTARYTDCIQLCEAVIANRQDGNYMGLAADYKTLFGADNNLYVKGIAGEQREMIFCAPQHPDSIQTWGGSTFLTNGCYGDDMNPVSNYGVNGVWGGPRATPQLADAFEQSDVRALFYMKNRIKENTDFTNFKNGYSVIKFTNLYFLTQPNDPLPATVTSYADTDFPIFRLADVYLMYIECGLRGAAAPNSLEYANYLRARAGLDDMPNADLNLDYVLKERLREFYWEGQRRTDLIRFNKFAGMNVNYNWSWKGGVLEGKPVDIKYNLYPIPAQDIAANPRLKQNPGY